MTKQDLDFWGPPPYRCTLTDSNGIPIGTVFPDGTIEYLQPSKEEDENFIIVWDGTRKDKHGNTKGRLLPEDGPSFTVDSTLVLKELDNKNG